MTKLFEEGIVFDRVFFQAILKRAAQEEFIKNYHPEPVFEWITHGKTKLALKMLLLYGKVYYPDLYLSSYKPLTLDIIWNELVHQGLIEIPPLPNVAYETNPKVIDFLRDCNAIKELIVSNKNRAKRCFNPYNLEVMKYSYKYCNAKFYSMCKILTILSNEKDTVTDIVSGFLVGYDNLKVILQRYNLTNSELVALCSPFDNQTQILISTIFGTEKELHHFKSLLEFSSEFKIPVLTDDVSVPESSTKHIKGLKNIKEGKNSQIALGIFFNEELRPVLPVIHSIKDVLRLREDPRIIDFRNKIFEWTIKIKEGETSLTKIKKEMIEANKKLKTLGKCEKIGTWITFLSLPIDIVLTISGVPLSIVTSLISFEVACGSKLLKKDYNWYLFGVQ